MNLSADTLMQALTASDAEIARLKAENSVLRGQLGVAARELRAAQDGAKALKAELDRLQLGRAMQAQPGASRFELLEVE